MADAAIKTRRNFAQICVGSVGWCEKESTPDWLPSHFKISTGIGDRSDTRNAIEKLFESHHFPLVSSSFAEPRLHLVCASVSRRISAKARWGELIDSLFEEEPSVGLISPVYTTRSTRSRSYGLSPPFGPIICRWWAGLCLRAAPFSLRGKCKSSASLSRYNGAFGTLFCRLRRTRRWWWVIGFSSSVFFSSMRNGRLTRPTNERVGSPLLRLEIRLLIKREVFWQAVFCSFTHFLYNTRNVYVNWAKNLVEGVLHLSWNGLIQAAWRLNEAANFKLSFFSYIRACC